MSARRDAIMPTIGLSEHSPLPLWRAAELISPDGQITAARLKAEARARRLTHEVVAGKTFVTLRYLAEWRPHYEARAFGLIYLCGFADYVKIGFTTNFRKRMSQLQNAAPCKLTTYLTMPGTVDDERRLQRRFKHLRLEGEWFTLSDEIKAWVKAQMARRQ